MFQAAILQANGFRVVVCDISDGGHEAFHFPEGVERRILERVEGTSPAGHLSPLRRVLARRAFQSRLALTLDELNPGLVISYDPPAFATLARLSTGRRRGRFVSVWHYHEAPIISDPTGWGTRRDHDLAKRRIAMADLVLVPDRHRLTNLFSDFAFSSSPIVVMNCPRHLRTLPDPERPQVRHINRNVLYIGTVGEGHELEVAIESMALWPQDAHFVIIGPTTNSYRCKLLSLAASRGHGNRVFVMEPVSADKALALRVGADLLVTVMDINQPTYRYCAGASNKRFEAMAAGVAQVTNEGPGINELFVKHGVAVAVKHDDVEATGAAVAALLADRSRSQAMGARARALHLEQYNYEAEFAPVLERITAFMKHR